MSQMIVCQDISGVGEISMTAALPVLNVMGHQTFLFPTMYLSAQPALGENGIEISFEKHFHDILDHWRRLKLDFSGLFLGYLGSNAGIELAQELIVFAQEQQAMLCLDPVMGDEGKLYQRFDGSYVKKMQKLVQNADYLIPNLTELCLLLEVPYESHPTSVQLGNWLKLAVERFNLNAIIVTGVSQEHDLSVWVLEKNREATVYHTPELPGHYYGAGDLFASVVFGGLMRQQSLESSVELALQFLNCSLTQTASNYDPRLGIMFEPFLGQLIS